LQLVIEKSIEEAQDRISLKKIKLEIIQPSNAASALVDMDKIKIAILNIIINAVEAMEEGKGLLQITIRSKPDFHEVIISDNGCGMSEETAARLFEPYYTSKPTGVGLGLASAFAIIQSHKSTIAVASKLTEGTVFTISFPSL
jgi:signal transduction histidine kinase